MLLFASDIFGPMLTGGISSRLPSVAGPEQRSQRRAQSWDVASFGLSGTVGPAAASDALTATLFWPEPPSLVRDPSSRSPDKSRSTRQLTCHRPMWRIGRGMRSGTTSPVSSMTSDVRGYDGVAFGALVVRRNS